jgi:hypothetical protein
MRDAPAILLFLLTALLLTSNVSAQFAPESGCADCHFSRPEAPRQDHLADWDRSPHGRNNIGCERCHGGNPRTFEKLPAHIGILGPSDPKSLVHRRNLPTTCGGCHTGPFVAFQDSRHYQLLQSADQRGPTCSTCHGEVSGRVLSSKALASQCGNCHGAGEVAPRADRVRLARETYDGLASVREEMKLARSLIRRVDNKERRAELNTAYEQAEVPLTRAVNAGHKFIYDELREYLMVAQQRVAALMSRLANR